MSKVDGSLLSGTTVAFLLVMATPALAQVEATADGGPDHKPAAGTEVSASTDSDGTQVVKVLGRALWNLEGREKYAGIALEHVWFSPSGGESSEDDRVYFDIADKIGENWRWKARIGFDGHSALGSAEIRKADWSRSFFLEREIVETSQGLSEKIYYTFVGASIDLPIDDNNTIALTTGLQEFSGKNERLHLRGKYVHVIKANAGLSVQLDARYYHSTEPGEFDYFSPSDFIRILPLVQVRRFNDDGWMFLAAGGIGAQHSTGSKWQAARLGQLRIESPMSSSDLTAFAELTYTNDSISGGTNYDYLMGRAGFTFRF